MMLNKPVYEYLFYTERVQTKITLATYLDDTLGCT